MGAQAELSKEPRWLLKVLGAITDVREGEAITALLLTLNVFLLLSAYYMIKPVREALILALESGAEYKAYMSGAIAIALLVAVPAYARFVDRLPRIRLVIGVTLFFAAQLVPFFIATQIPALRANLGLLFYLWVGIFNMMVVAQFWAFANDVYTEEQGNRLFALVALGGSLGAAVGSEISALLIPVLGVSAMLLVAAALLVVCAGLFWLVERRESRRAEQSPAGPAQDGAPPSRDDVHPALGGTNHATSHSGKSSGGAFQMVFQHRYLLLVALFSLVFSWVNTNGEYMLGKLIKADAQGAVEKGLIGKAEVGAYIGAAYGQFFFYVNVLGVLLQTLAVSRLVRWLGLSAAFLVLPLVALADAGAVALVPLLAVIRIGKLAENALDYSLNNTLRQMLWLVTTREMKYKAKQAIDTFFVRLGDVSSALSVWILISQVHFSIQHFAWVSVALVMVWLVLAVLIGRSHRTQSAQLEVAA